jgi:ABC-type microcin C transport system duplicated ATPase subunit YejF
MNDAPTQPLLDVRGLQKFFPISKGFLQRTVGHVRAVDGVDFTVNEGDLPVLSRRAISQLAPTTAPMTTIAV